MEVHVYYYPLRMLDGWRIVKRTEVTKPVEYDFDYMRAPNAEKARQICEQLNTGGNDNAERGE